MTMTLASLSSRLVVLIVVLLSSSSYVPLKVCDAFAFHNNNININNNNNNNNHRRRITTRRSSITSSSKLYVSTEQQQTEQKEQKQKKKLPGTAILDKPWEDLGFEYRETNSHVSLTWKDGSGWSEPELVKEPYVNVHIGATALHYGQACFEGLKAFTHKDGDVYCFRPEENAARMQSSCRRIMMPEVPTELFVDAVKLCINSNIEYVPPYGSNGALYIRPLLFGSGSRIGLQPADEYKFIVLCMPVADYYKGGLSTPVDALIIKNYDRAAPRGVGAVKVAGNYAADLLPNQLSKKRGYPIGLYLDAATQSYVEEFSTSNFVGIDNSHKKYVTPFSPTSVLPSITNKSLMQIAKDVGYTVEERNVKVEELDDFDEVMAVGTAVVVTPVGSATLLNNYDDDNNNDDDKNNIVYEFGNGGNNDNDDDVVIGETTKKLYKIVREIQNGERDDIHGWNVKV